MFILTGIYLIINTINGKIYIGSSVDIIQRWFEHASALDRNMHKNKHLQAAWNKYGGEPFFHFCVVEECTIENLLIIEQLWLDGNFDKSYNKNPIAGNTLGKFHSEETKLKISISKIGTKHSEESKIKMRAKKLSIEHLEKLKFASLNRSPEIIAKLAAKSRRPEKWPHPWGRRCVCDECMKIKREYNRNWYHKNKVLSCTF